MCADADAPPATIRNRETPWLVLYAFVTPATFGVHLDHSTHGCRHVPPLPPTVELVVVLVVLRLPPLRAEPAVPCVQATSR